MEMILNESLSIMTENGFSKATRKPFDRLFNRFHEGSCHVVKQTNILNILPILNIVSREHIQGYTLERLLEIKHSVSEHTGNGSQSKNPDISGALYTLRIQYSYTVYGILKLNLYGILKLNMKMAPEMSRFFN